jgi:hypothetical protein
MYGRKLLLLVPYRRGRRVSGAEKMEEMRERDPLQWAMAKMLIQALKNGAKKEKEKLECPN